jgi:tripartite-type tricarboxylate transporter receptor subunit TctC
LLVAIVLVATPAAPASVQDAVAQFFRGRQITLIVGSSAGGGYDV